MEVQSRKSTFVYLSHEEDTFPIASTSGGGSGSGGCTDVNRRSPSPSKTSKQRSSTCPISWRYRWLEWLKIFGLAQLAIANVAISLWIVFVHGNLPEMFPGEIHTNTKHTDLKKCHFPELLPFAPEIKHLLEQPIPLNCPLAANSDYRGRIAFTTDRDNNLIRLFNPYIPCCYRPFYRTNDNEVWIEPTPYHTYVCHNITQDVTKMDPKHEFIEVICDDQRKTYRDGFAFVHRKSPKAAAKKRPQIAKKILSSKPGPERLSVMLFGFDSTSQLNFIRKMPKSYEYLKSLKAIRLNGYNKVGDNTLPNMVPLLTGLELQEFKDLCVDPYPPAESTVHIDACPFVWKQFGANGYVTSFAEDDTTIGIFNMYWSHAFKNPPTDHYFRPFSVRMHSAQNSYDGMCQGSKMSFEHLLNNLEKTAKTYKDDLLFQLSFAAKLTHDDFNKLAWADSILFDSLKFLHDNGNFNNTAFILFGDHGSRKQEMRRTRQGQLEDRMPLAYILLPTWFSAKYPLAYKNLEQNSDALTSAFDLHETIKDFMDLGDLTDLNVHYKRLRDLKVAEHKGQRQGTSLFAAHPSYRGCISAGIPPHWCICYNKHPISNKSPEVYEAIAFVIKSMNNQILPWRQKCTRLQWKKIIKVLKWHPEEQIQNSFNGNSEENHKRSSLLQISFVTKPGDGKFEVTVLHEPDQGWRLTEDLVRLDQYSEHSFCMPKQELKKLCFCVKHKEDKIDNEHGDFIGFP